MNRMSIGEVMRLVNHYIGVDAGYLGDFNYSSHRDFYLELDLEINPDQIEGTTRERFIEILRNANQATQATIIEGVMLRYPVGSTPLRTQEKFDEFMSIASRLKSTGGIASPNLTTSSEVVRRAIHDAESLMVSSGATSGVDRIHTALHGYLLAICSSIQIQAPPTSTMNQLYRMIREKHPALQNLGPRADDIESLLKTFCNVFDVLNPIRNQASVAHPNNELLDPAEATLVINVAKTLLHYLNTKLIHTE